MDTLGDPGAARDQRNIINGRRIPAVNYVDQPYIVVLPDGAWLCVLTTGSGIEGDTGQHILSVRSHDQGMTWSDPVVIEPPDGPEASFIVPLHVPGLGGPLGRVYGFYGYNRDNLREVPGEYETIRRMDTMGYFVFRYTDDGGLTWSREQYEVPVREFEIDRNNPTGGKVRYFWSVCKPLVHDGRVYIALHKVGNFGDGFMKPSEGCILASDNVLTESDPARILWETLPDGDIGLRAANGTPVADEQNLTYLSDGTLFCVWRTTEGHPSHAYSRDGGHTWTPPAQLTYGPGARKVKHPRAANFVRRFSNGKFLYWFHNHGGRWYDGRNPVWLTGGEEVDTPEGRRIRWSEPEIFLYEDEIGLRMSYPDYVEDGGEIFISETQKTIARVHPVPHRIIEALWDLPHRAQISRDGVQWETSGEGEVDMPTLPRLWRNRGGFTLDFIARFADLTPHQVLFDSRDATGRGITVTLTDRATVRITLSGNTCSIFSHKEGNGFNESSWECDTGLLRAGETHRFTAIVDGGPKLILWVVDGQLCDGGETRPCGWGRFHFHLDDLNAAPAAKIAPSLRGEMIAFRLYDRALLVNEVAANHRAATSTPCPSPAAGEG